MELLKELVTPALGVNPPPIPVDLAVSLPSLLELGATATHLNPSLMRRLGFLVSLLSPTKVSSELDPRALSKAKG